MNRALFNRRVRQLHLWLGLAIGAQVGLWLISGLFMTWFPIEHVRGEHLRAEIEPGVLGEIEEFLPAATIIQNSEIAAESLSLRMMMDQPVWLVLGDESRVLIDARTGEKLSPLPEDLAIRQARLSYNGKGDVLSTSFLIDPPREYGRPGPVWRVNFGPEQAASFYVDASIGEVQAVRTTLWRVFDFMWGLHIMDWSSRENFNSWWIKMTASLAVLFFLAGLGLAVRRVNSMISRQRRER